ncbi:MAG: type II toxin-antitoxin system prevent-host-death family antitoxin [Myxococcaceae bacterium]|nr:type II toxin-antitoxin system prevent-host-death family antitoxin [Myxococcaceae bacterium]MBH2005964.1 type II toxin-antitoxin system prevent-host-death family antitoxin [Myxococcaceae bacterium]
MDAISDAQARRNFTKTMKRVCSDHAPLMITRQNEAPVVMLSLEDFNAIAETLHLLRTPNNAQRLNDAVRDVKNGIDLSILSSPIV